MSTVSLAAQQGMIECLTTLLTYRFDGTREDLAGNTPAHHAALKGHTTCLAALHKESLIGPHVNARGATPLTLAAEGDHIDAVRFLIRTSLFQDRQAAIQIALRRNSIRCLTELLANATADHVGGVAENGETALTEAVSRQDIEAVRLLHHFSPNLPNHVGQTAIEIATLQNWEPGVALLSHGASQTRRLNAVIFAVQLNHVGCLKTLVANNFVDVADEDGRTALMHAAAQGDHRTVDCLLLWGASPRAVDKQSRTALHVASARARLNCLQSLVPLADLDVPDAGGFTPLHLAAMAGSEECLRVLLQEGHNVHGISPYHLPMSPSENPLHATTHAPARPPYTPLCYAVFGGFPRCAELLTKHGAALNTFTSNGTSPLIHATLEAMR